MILAQRRKYWKLKGVIDVAIASLLLVILTPVIVAVGFSVRLGIGSLVIFWQRRVGRNGAAFFFSNLGRYWLHLMDMAIIRMNPGEFRALGLSCDACGWTRFHNSSMYCVGKCRS